MLLDYSGTDNYNLLRSWGQGAGHVGVGILTDVEGDDSYFCGSMAQGYGGTLGLGALIDNAGDDKYIADLDGRRQSIYINQSVSFVQGSGCGRRADYKSDNRSMGGGIGVLVDGGQGNDFYKSAAYGQGNAYWWSMGICEDRGGNDVYEMMQYGLGTAPHFAIGVCVNLSGNDKYNIDNYIMQRLMGHGRDGSIGYFIDGDGDDQYVFTSDSCGYADLNTIAFFWDRRGNDIYNMVPTRGNLCGFGGTAPYKEFKNLRDVIPTIGVFLDTEGKDSYVNAFEMPGASKNGRKTPAKNNSVWRETIGSKFNRWGIGIDVDFFFPE